MLDQFAVWLIEGGVGPAVVALPVSFAGAAGADAARNWFRRLRRADDLSRLVRSAAGGRSGLTAAEFAAVRNLLSEGHTWVAARKGTVEDLAVLIGACIPPGTGRSAEDSRAAARVIARGLLEFGVADLEPKLFQQVLFARLQRLRDNLASALDAELLGLHADLGVRFDGVMEQFKLVLDRLPPGPAQRGETVVYLRTLIGWLSSDPWPHDRQLRGPVLKPAAIERKLQITASGRRGASADARSAEAKDGDELGRRCTRLVVLGGPGAGKTWFARRTARLCAEAALDALAAGALLDEVEFPLYVTCSRLRNAVSGENIRHAVVAAALGDLPDMGGSRVSAAIGTLFEERNAPVLLVADSLDEAGDEHSRVRLLGSLPAAWRVVLTSRPAVWNDEIDISGPDPDQVVGILEPLRYPDDVEPLIADWFAGEPQHAAELAAQLAESPALRQAATVPLIVAFFCILGGEPLPASRADLYAKVIRRLLTGLWHGSGARRRDLDGCVRVLRGWAWSAAASDPVSGTGAWMEEFTADENGLLPADREALDHVAVPTGPPNLDSETMQRRFAHRSLREHLVAEHIAGLPADQAARILLPHLWFDPDWEYAAPAAIAMHPQRDEVLMALICRAARSRAVPPGVSVIDASGEFRRLLARTASESAESSWSPQNAAIISQARADLVTMGKISELDPAPHWETSNRQIREMLLQLMAAEMLSTTALELAQGLLQLQPTRDDRSSACQNLVQLLGSNGRVHATGLADMLIRLGASARQRELAREMLLRLLATEQLAYEAQTMADAIARLDPAEDERTQVCVMLLRLAADEGSGDWHSDVADTIRSLALTPGGQRNAREFLLTLAGQDPGNHAALDLTWIMAALGPTADDRRRARSAVLKALVAGTAGRPEDVAAALAMLTRTAEEKRDTRDSLTKLLTAPATGSKITAAVAAAFAALGPAAEEQHRASTLILERLLQETDGEAAWHLASTTAELGLPSGTCDQFRRKLMDLTESETDGWRAGDLVSLLTRLGLSAAERRRATERLLTLICSPEQEQVWDLWQSLKRFTLTAEQRERMHCRTLELFYSSAADRCAAADRAEILLELGLTAQERPKARQKILELLASETDDLAVSALCDLLAQMEPTEAERHKASQEMIRMLEHGGGDIDAADDMAAAAIRLAATAGEQRDTRHALLNLIRDETDFDQAERLMHTAADTAVSLEDKAQTRHDLLELLTRLTDSDLIWKLVETLAALRPTTADRSRARMRLLELLVTGNSSEAAWGLAETMASLTPSAGDLTACDAWAAPPTVRLLAEVRKNSPPAAWLGVLPSLCGNRT